MSSTIQDRLDFFKIEEKDRKALKDTGPILESAFDELLANFMIIFWHSLASLKNLQAI